MRGLCEYGEDPSDSDYFVLMYNWTKTCLLLPSQLLSNANSQRPILMAWSDDCPVR